MPEVASSVISLAIAVIYKETERSELSVWTLSHLKVLFWTHIFELEETENGNIVDSRCRNPLRGRRPTRDSSLIGR